MSVIAQMSERIKKLETENKQLNESLFWPVTFHRCPDGQIQTYPAIFCSRHPMCSDNVDFDAVKRIKELETLIGV